MIKIISKLILLSLFLTIYLSSCETKQECEIKPESFVNVNFYIDNNGTEKAVKLNLKKVYGLGRQDSLLYENDTISSVLLPLSPQVKFLTYIFEIDDLTEEISFNYKSSTYLESIECGFIANYELDSINYNNTVIDTIIIINNSVTIEKEENVKIIFK